MPLHRNKLKEIYGTLKSGGFERTYDDFESRFAGSNNYSYRKKIYDLMSANGDVDAPSYEDWMKELHFVQTVKKAAPKAVANQPATEDKTTKLLDSVQSTLNENRRVQNRMDYAMGKTGLKTPETNLGWKGKSTLGFGGNVVETKRRNYVTGGEEKVYLTESGNEYGSRAMADVEQGQLDEARFMRENKRAYLMREKERIEREMNQRRGEVKRAEEEKYKKIWDGPLKYLSSMPRGGGVGFNPSADNLGVWGDKKYKTLNAQLKQVEDALATLDEAEAGKKSDAWIADSSNAWERNAKKLAGFGGGAWRGLAHSVGKISTWDFGITDMETNKSVLDAANAVDKGTEATKEDQELLDLVAYKNMVEKESEPYLGYGYTAGSITGESLPFMLEMAINPASGVGKGAMKASMRGMLKKYGKEKLKSNFKKYLLAKAGARVAGDVAGAHAMALTTGQGRVIADTMRRLTGDVQYGVNDNGQIVYSGRKVDVDGLAEAYLKSFESQAIENHSEMLGEYFAPLLTRAGKAIGKPIGKGLEKLRLGGVNQFIEDVGASKTAKLIDDFSKKTQWNGSIGEYAEEVAGGIENAMIVGDQTLDTDEQTGVFNLEKNIETFLGVGLMGGFMFGAKLASYRGPKRGALQEMEAAGNRVDRALGGKMQARAQWGEWRSKLLLGNEEEKKNTLREIMDNEKLPIQFRNAVADFSRAAQKYEGLCRAEQSKRLEGTADPVGSSLDDAADAGYELNDPQEMTRTRLALDSERERMAAYLGVEVDQVDATVGENLFDYVDNLRNRGVTGEELNRVMDYARARSRYEGMQMRLEDDTNTRIDNVHANMARYAHRENGTVQTGAVKTKDGSRPVWIVSGNLVFEGEGKDRGVNPVKSDESIFVIDAKTGQVEMHPATDFVSLGEPVSAEAVNAYYESSVREQMKKAFEANTHAELSEEKPAEDGELAPANETEGAAVEPAAGNATEPAKPAYEVGDVVTLETEEGPVSVEVQAVTADGVEVRTDEPWRGQVVQVIPTEEFEGMMKKPVVEESSATESDRYTEGSPERVEAGDNLIVTDEEGNDRSLKVVRRVSMRPSEKGGLEPQEDANGKIVELVDDATGETVRMWDSELAERTKGYMRPVSGSEVESGESSEGQQENPQQGVMPSPKSAEGEGVEQAEQAAPAAEPAQPKRNEIPVDEKTGEPVYEAADPGAAWDALVEEAEGDEELAMETVNAMVRDMEEKVKKAKNAKLRAGATAHEKMEAQKERKRHIAEAEERLESWKRIAGVKAERAAAAEASVVESSVSESPVVESPVAESPATVETPAAEEATPVQEGAQTPVQEGARGGVQVPHADSAGQEATQDSVTGAAPVAEQTGTTPKGVEAIPTRKNNKGEEEVLYHKVPVARTMADLYDGGMDQEEIDGFVEANSAEAAREVKRIEGKKPKMTTNKAKYMEAKRAWQAELDEAREKEAYWKEVGKEVKRVTHRDEAPVSAEGRGHAAALGEDMPKDEPMDVYEVVASALGRGRIKITPESFRAETGYSVNDQKKYPGMVASAENGGVSVERAAEMLMEDADMAGFPSDDYTIRQAIIDVLQDGHPAGYISRRREEARRRAAERDEREREEYYQDRYGMNADDGMAYEETAVPNALNQYGGVSEDELAAQSAEAAEAERMKREEDEQGNRAEDGGQQMEGKEESAGNEAASEVEEMPAAHEPAVDSSMPKTSFTQDEAADFVDKMEARAESVPEMELTIENWDSLFGEDGRVETPIGEVKMGENQFAKLMRQGRNGKLGMIKPTLESPDIIIEQASMAKEGDVTERPSSYLFIKAFTKPDGGRFYYFTSVSVSRDGKEVIISNQEKSRNKILRLMTEESVIWRTPNDAATSSAEKQGLDYAHPNNAEDETKGSGITPQSTSSAGKVTESQETEQGNEVASEVEEGGKQMEGEEKTNTFSLSEMDSGKGGRLYQDAAGNTNLVSIPNEVFEAMGMSPVPFSLTESMAEHVLKHKTELGLSSKEDAVRYVVAVMKNADHVRAGDKPGSFVFSVENGRRKVGKRAIAVQVDGSSGKFLGISTSGNERVSNLQKRPLLWEKGVNETSATGSAPANVTSETAEQNGGELDGNASNQSNDLSADKVTESKETEQVGARVKAEGEEAEVSKDETPKEYKYRRNSDIDTLPDGYLRLGKDERGFDVAFYDHPLSRKEVERFHMGPITESNELVGKVYEVTRGLVTITYRVVGAEDGFVLFTDNGSFDYRTLPYYKFMDWVVAKGKEVGTEVKASGKAREARAKDGTQPVSESEAGLRDALVDVARAAGVEVVTDSKEGQRVLDEVNGKARLSAKQKRALETASLSQSEKDHSTVVSSADGAKVLNNLDILAKELLGKSNRPKTFLGDVAKAIGASNKGSSSQYATFETKNGTVVTIRLANHNASTKRMDDAGQDNAISIVITNKPNEGIQDGGDAHIVEFYYNALKLGRADGHPLAEIVRSIQQALYSGEYKDTTGLAERQEVNTTFENLREHRVYHGSGAEFEEFDHSHMGEGEGAQAYGWGTYVTEVEGIGRAYASQNKGRISYKGKSVQEIQKLYEEGVSPYNVVYSVIIEMEGGLDFSQAKEMLESDWRSSLEYDVAEGDEESADGWRQNLSELASLKESDFSKREGSHLYTVEIPEDNGSNYLHWEKPLTREQLSSVAEALKADGWSEVEGNHPTFTKNDNKIVLNERAAGCDVYAELEEAMGSQQKASEFLSSIGFTGVSMPAQFRSGGREDNSRNFVIFNEKDAQITDHARFFKTENGEAYGFTVGGKVYLDPKIATTETAVHELTHLWADMLRKENPKEWKHVVELMKGTPVWDEVKAKYPELKTEDEIADEVLAHYSGRRGAERLRAEQQRLAREEGVSMLDRASAVAAIERVKDALNSFWKKVADLLGIHFKSAEEVADAALADILNGRVKLTAAEGMKEDRKELVAVHNITKDKLKQAMELGGFPMPSIAITKAGVGHTSFGDISLVFDKESINPTDKRNKVYGEDAWTPVFPGVGYKLNDKKTAEIYRRANNADQGKELPLYNPVMFHPDNYRDKAGANGAADLVEHFKNSYDAKQLYLAERDHAVTEYAKREEEKYTPERIRLYEKMLEEIGLARLQNESLEELREDIKRLYKAFGGVDIDQKPQRVERAYLDGAKRKAVDYALHGNRNVADDVLATQREIDGRIDQQQFEEWLGEMFSGIVEKKGVRNGKDAYTPSGNARKWEQLYDEITLDNVMAAMQKQAAKGGEGLLGGNIFGTAQAEYQSIDEIRKAAKERIRTINEEEYQAQRSAITDRLSAIEIPGSGSGFLGSMEMEQHIHDAVSKSHTAKGIHKYLKKFYPGITMETAEEIADIVQDIQHMSARYFEAKPYRAVGFDEVKLAVVPSDMDAALKERLEQMGIEVRTYASGDQAQRKRVVDEATEELRIRFQLVGEKGAANMDKAEEATTRLDNLSVAREMEEAFEEKKKRIEKLRKSDSVVVDGNEYLGKYELNSKSAGDYILSSLRRGYKNTDTNELIHISRKSQKVAHHDAENEVHLKSIAYIPQLIEHAIFIDEIPNSKSKNGFDSYRYYVVGFNIGGVDYTVRLTVGVKNGQSYYDHALTKIEKGNLLNLTDGVKADVSEKETAISDVKDKRLLSLLRMNEQENARKIKLATGWERGADGKWRYEVGDIGRMNFLGNARFIRNNPDAQRYGELNYKKLASLLIGGEKLTEEEEEEFSKLVKKFSGELDFNKKPMSKGNQLTLGDYFDADELFAAYPELEDVPVYAEQLEDGVLGYASEADSDFMGFVPVGFMNSLGKPVSSPYKIVVSQDFLEEAAKTLDESVKRRLQSVFIHEIQHLIQEIEGFAKGGSATTYRNHIDELKWGHDVWSWAMEFEAKHQELGKDASREDVYYELVNEFKEDGHEFGDSYAPSREVFDKAYEVWTRGYDNMGYEAAYKEYQYLTGKFGLGFENNRYHQLAGEVEARNVQSRMDMTAEERRASLAEETEDVAREDQVFIMDGIESANSLGDSFETFKGEEAISHLNDLLAIDANELPSLPEPIDSLDRFRQIFAQPVRTVLGKMIKVKDGVFNKMARKEREKIAGGVLPTLQDADFVIKDTDGSKLYVKRYKNAENKHVYNITVVNKRDEVEDYISSVHIKSNNNLRNKIEKGAELLIPSKRTRYGEQAPSNSTPAAKVVEEFENPNVQGQETDDASYREVEQGELLDELRKASKEGRTVRVYRTMQVIDGKLYSPMAKKVAGQETSEIKFRWEAAEEHPELARRGDGSKAMPNEESFYITIDKGQGKGALTVAYNPYTHTSRTVLNDQFSSAFVRPNLVVVEVEVPESELEGLYKAEKAKDSVGEMSWHSGAVSGKLAELGNPRKVILSRYDRPVRILTKKEEAELIAKQLEGTGIAMPYNLVTPQVREELEKLGVKIDEKPSGSVSKNASFGKAEYVTDEQIEAMNGRLQANAVSSPEAMTEAARALSEQLGVPVEIVTDVDSITHPNEAVEVKRRRAKGWYDKRTGKVAIVVPNHLDVEDVAATVFHEVVAHRGLRELVGEQGYDEFLMEVFNHSKADVRERMMALAGKHGWDIPKAVDEYLGGLAERGFDDFSEAERGMWTWLKEKVLEAIDKFIGTLKLPKSVKLGDNELRYLLWRSHENLRAGREGMVKRAMDVAKRYELGLLENEAGERMIAGLETYRSAENRGNTRALPIRERAKAVAHLKPVLVERNEMSKEELRQIYNALPDAVKDGRSISFFHSAFKKNYKEGGLFAQVLPKLNEILKGSVFAYSEKDNRGGEVRPDGTVHKYHPNANAFDNYVGKVEIDGKEYYVRITVQEQQGQVGTHSFFVTSVDVYEKPVNGLSVPNFPSGESDHQRVVDAKLRQFFDEARREDKASEEEDLYRTAYHEAAARDAYERRVKSGLYQSREALQDSMLGLRTAMEEVLKAEGNGYSGRVEDIPGFENAYLGENRLSSVNQAEVDEFGRRLFKPLLEIAASFGSSKEARQALTDYMMAKHGLERNALMRERAKKKAMEELEGDALQKKLDSIEKRDFAGLTALTGKKKVADAEQAARKMVADFEQASGQNGDPNRIDKLWKAVHGVTGATLKKMKDSGLITKEQFDEISGMYDFYIPLRGFDGQTAEDVYDYLGHGGNGSAFTSPIKKAEGRKSKADDPFAYMAAMAESAIMQGNRNVLVKQKFLNFVLNHPSDLVSVSDLWLRYDAAAGEWRVAQSGDIAGTEKLEEGDSPEEVERKMAVFEERMQAEAKAHPKEYKRQKEHPEIPYRVVEKQDLREHQVIVKRNGRDYVLTINGSPRAAQALNGLTNPNLDVSGVAGTLMNGVRNTTNYLSQVYTTRNPNFVGSNWVRDAVYSNIMAGLKEDKEYGLEFSKAWFEANPRSMKKLYSLYEHGKLDMNNEKQRLFAEFMANGGETGYMSFRQIEERKNEIERQLKLYGGKMSLKKGWSGAWNMVDYANRVVENQSRFAAYMASRRSGRTIDRSIYDAKEITVNFNKKGAGSTFYNAKNQTLAGKVAGGVSGIGRFGFAFWNAAIQGTTNFARFVKRNPKKAVGACLSTMAFGFLVPTIAAILHDDDDDKEGNGYFDLPDAVRRNNIVFRFPGMESWITIPLPPVFNSLYGLGELTATAMYRASTGMPMTAGEIAGQAMGLISQLMPLDLSEGGGMDFTWGASGNFNALAPSAVKPVAEAWTNKSWTGLPVYKDTPYNKQDPEWTKAFKNTNTFLVKMCKQLNEWTGGDSVKGGAVDLNPAVMEHLLKGYLGGYMQTANQFGKLGETVFGDRENEFRNWPVVSRFLQEGDERTKWRAVTERYFNLKKEAEETDRLLKRYKKLTELGEDHQADIDELIKTDAYKRMEVYDFFENDIQKIQDVLKRNDLSEEEREQVEGELNEIRLELLKAVDELGNLTGLGTGRLGAVTGDLLAE